MSDQQIIISGFGGQGILSAGRILACRYVGKQAYRDCLPTPEMREQPIVM